MANWFLIIVYLAFISLGLPDAMLGSAWPIMEQDLNVPLGAAGFLFMITAGSTILSSLFSGKLIDRFGTGKITLFSCIMTAIALLGFSFAPTIFVIIPFAVLLGLGAGAVDSGLNNYVAKYYEVHHMNWLHSFWGVGAMGGPLLMSMYITHNNSWRSGYKAVSFLQMILIIILFLSLPMWKKIAKIKENEKEKTITKLDKLVVQEEKARNVFRIKGVKDSFITFLFYCATEATVGLWGASYLVGVRNFMPEVAAKTVSFYYGGIMIGRMLSGLISMKVSNEKLIKTAQIVSLSGVLVLLLPVGDVVAQISFVVIGFGLAPIFPGLIHETPKRFGKENSAKIIGYQMAMAYTGTTFLPPLFGVFATKISINLFPVTIFVFLAFMIFHAERVVIRIKNNCNV